MTEIDTAANAAVSSPDSAPVASSRLGFETLLLRFGTYAYALPGSIVLARALGPTGRGSYQVAVTVALVALTVALVGLPQSQFRSWGRVPPDQMLAVARLAAVTLGGLGAAACVFAALGGIGSPDNSTSNALLVIAATLPVQVYAASLTWILQSAGRTRAVTVSLAASGVIQTTAILALGLQGRLTVLSAAGSYAVGLTSQFLLLRIAARRIGTPSVWAPWKAAVRLARAGLVFQIFLVASFLLLRIDVLLMARIADLEEVGIYSIGVTLAELVWLVTDSLALTLVERATHAEESEALEVFVRAVRMALLLGVIAAGLAAAFAPFGVRLLFGGDFGEAAPVVLVLLPGAAAFGVWRSVSTAIARFGGIWTLPVYAGTALVLNVVLNIVLIGRLGAVGAAVASAAAYGMLAALVLRWLLERTGLPLVAVLPRAHEVRQLAKVALWRTT